MTDYTCDVLVLEDDSISRRHISRVMPTGASCEYADSVTQFREFLEGGGKAKLYILDDRVPFSPGGKSEDNPANPHFIDNCIALYNRQPDAKVFYNGICPGSEENKFCKEHSIEMPMKHDIFALGDLIERELSSLGHKKFDLTTFIPLLPLIPTGQS